MAGTMADLWIDLLNIQLIHNANMEGRAFWGDGTPFVARPHMVGFDNNDPAECFRSTGAIIFNKSRIFTAPVIVIRGCHGCLVMGFPADIWLKCGTNNSCLNWLQISR